MRVVGGEQTGDVAGQDGVREADRAAERSHDEELQDCSGDNLPAGHI